MADSKNDITTEVTATDQDVAELKKAQYSANPSTRLPRPAQVAEIPQGLNPELVQRLKMGQKTAMFSGIVRCIQVLDAGTPHQHHCMSMIVNNLSTNEAACTRCTKTQVSGVPQPRVINSSMIRLGKQDLEELGLKEDPLAKGAPSPDEPKKSRQKPAKVAESAPRRTKVKAPNHINIEVSMADLKADPNIVNVLLHRTLEAIFELPVSNFREAEEIRVVKERVESFLQPDKGDKNG